MQQNAFLLVPAIKGCIYISTHFLTSQPTLIKLDIENIGGHLTPLQQAVATSNNMKLVHWPLMGGLLHYSEGWGTGQGRSPPRPLLAVTNVTAHPSTASVPITLLLHNGPLLCGFNVAVKRLCYLFPVLSRICDESINLSSFSFFSLDHLCHQVFSSKFTVWTETDI